MPEHDIRAGLLFSPDLGRILLMRRCYFLASGKSMDASIWAGRVCFAKRPRRLHQWQRYGEFMYSRDTQAFHESFVLKRVIAQRVTTVDTSWLALLCSYCQRGLHTVSESKRPCIKDCPSGSAQSSNFKEVAKGVAPEFKSSWKISDSLSAARSTHLYHLC